MSWSTPNLDASQESLVGRVIEEYQERVRRGERPDVEEYARLHPPIAEVLRHLLPAVRLLQPPARPGLPGDLEGYEVLREVGRGGMGVVYEARDRRLNRVVALKMVLARGQARPEDLVRFVAEAEAVARLQHPNIVPVFEAGQHDGLPYFTMEYVAGGSLAARLQGGPLPPADAAALLEPLARAMHYAHQKGVVHRDLKPANVLLSEVAILREPRSDPASERRDYSPKITDFGLAKRVEGGTGLTRTGAILGTPSYMAPEQARGRAADVGPHSDTWALGAILYECLTGRPPFQGPTPTDTLMQVTHDEPVPPRRLQPGVPRDLETIALKCLQKEPAHRYASAGALADDLRRFRAGEPIRARPVGPLGRGLRWCRRNPAVAGLTAVTAATLVVGLVAVAALWRRAERNYQVAESQRERAEENERRAGEQRDRAEEERRVAEAVQRFLRADLLRQADPLTQAETLRLAGGPEPRANPTIKELLDRAADGLAEGRIEAKFPSQPRVQAEILHTVGNTYMDLGEYDKAIDHLARATELNRRALGPADRQTLTAWHNLAAATRRAGKTREAIALLEQVRDAKAEALGPADPSTLATVNHLGMAYLEAGRIPQATALFEQVRDARAAALGPRHPDTLTALNHLAMAKRRAGKIDEAITLFERVLDARKSDLGPAHPSTIVSANNLASAYFWSKRLDRSIPLFEEALRHSEAVVGRDHPETLATMANLGVNYRDAGRGPDAVATLVEAWARARKRPGPPPPATEWIPRALAETYDQLGRFGEAEPLYRELLGQARRPGVARSRLVGSLNRLALCLLRQRNHAGAEPLARESLTVCEKDWPESWVAFETRALLGGALLGRKKYAEAGPLLRAGYEGMKERAAKVRPADRARLGEALDWLVELAEAEGDKAQAEKWRKER
jgi:tetratricopeptide (TPR) repeat protein/tRNA A-37 threonylcarbamoyl transferase component Bud32